LTFGGAAAEFATVHLSALLVVWCPNLLAVD
jgi:hypothetical protein